MQATINLGHLSSNQYYYFFDLDGTLCNSEHISALALQNTIKEMSGKEVSFEKALSYSFGKSMNDIVNAVYADYSISESKHQFLETMWTHFKEMRSQHRNQFLIQPTVQLFKFLVENKQPVCIVSGSYRADIAEVLQLMNIKENIPIFGNEDYRAGKPNPEPYQVAAKHFNIAEDSYRQVIVFEDSPAGVSSAVKAGMHVIGLQSTALNDSLSRYGAHAVLMQKEIGAESGEATVNLMEWLNQHLLSIHQQEDLENNKTIKFKV